MNKEISEKQQLLLAEQIAWEELRGYIDFTDKCKKRVYKNQKPYSPQSVPEVEAEFTRLIRRWEKAAHQLEEANGSRLPVRSASPPEEGDTRHPRLNSQPAS